jgi:hypothetical protein
MKDTSRKYWLVEQVKLWMQLDTDVVRPVEWTSLGNRRIGGPMSSSSDRERLDALRRVTTRNGATEPEAETAGRLADELEAKIGKQTSARQRKGGSEALPEPPQARRRRKLAGWAERTVAMVGSLLLVLIVIYFSTTPVMFGLAMLGDRSAVFDWIVRVKLTALAVGLLCGLLILAPLSFLVWFLRTPPGTRLRTAAVWLATLGLPFVLLAGLGIATERVEKAYNLRGFYSIACWAAIAAVGYALVSLYARLLGHRIAPNALHVSRGL